MAKEVFNFDFCGRKLTVETGEIAKQAGGSVIVRYEDTVVLSTATASHVAKDTDFFPLTVTFEEKLYYHTDCKDDHKGHKHKRKDHYCDHPQRK